MPAGFWKGKGTQCRPPHYLESNGLEQSQWRIDLVSIQLDRAGKVLGIDHLENAVEL